MINRNMRCIETAQYGLRLSRQLGLIETWDVLKLFMVGFLLKKVYRLIETWDVLKPPVLKLVLEDWRLIETWDVLKHCGLRKIA